MNYLVLKSKVLEMKAGAKRNLYISGSNLEKWDNIPKGFRSKLFNNWLKNLDLSGIEIVEKETVEIVKKVKIGKYHKIVIDGEELFSRFEIKE